MLLYPCTTNICEFICLQRPLLAIRSTIVEAHKFQSNRICLHQFGQFCYLQRHNLQLLWCLLFKIYRRLTTKIILHLLSGHRRLIFSPITSGSHLWAAATTTTGHQEIVISHNLDINLVFCVINQLLSNNSVFIYKLFTNISIN